jgi:hypothetical protein
MKEAQQASQKVYDVAEKGGKREKGILEEIDATLVRLEKSKRKAFTYEDIEKYNKKILEAKQHLGEYEKAGQQVEKQTESMAQTFGKWVMGLGLVVTVLNKLKQAFEDTRQGMIIFAQAGAAVNQVLYNMVNNVGNWNENVGQAIVLAKKMAELQIKDSLEKVRANKLMREYNKLYTEANEIAGTNIERISKLTEAKRNFIDALKLEIASTAEQLMIAKEQWGLAPTSETARKAVFALTNELSNLIEQKSQGVRRLSRTIANEEARIFTDVRDEIKKALEDIEKWQEDYTEETKKDVEKRKKYLHDTDLEAFRENEKFIEDYLKADEQAKDKEWEDEVDFQRKIAKAKRDAAKESYDMQLVIAEKVKKLEDDAKAQRIENLLATGDAIVQYIGLIQQLVDAEVLRKEKERELLDTRISELESEINTEAELRDKGVASNVKAREAELAAVKKQRDKALKDEEAARKKQHTLMIAGLLAQQAVDIARIIASTAVANAAARVAQAEGMATFNPAMVAAAQALIVANRVAAAIGIASLVAAIATAATAKYAKGGWTGEGKRRDETGERIAGVVHEKEFVIRKGPANKFREVLEAINRDDKKMIFNSFNKLTPELIGGNTVNNVIVENEGPNKRLDILVTEQRRLNKRLSTLESIHDTVHETIIRKGNTTRVIKK